MTGLLKLAFAAVLLLTPAVAQAAPEIGKPAPDFAATDIEGKPVKLSDLKGKTVVLEWTNHECPYVVKHYGAGNMQATQKQALANNTVWISILSSAKGKEGYMSNEEIVAEMKKQGGTPSYIITDPDGTLGKLYEAKTTPHMFVIDKQGVLAYMGAIDDKPTADPKDIEGARNYVSAALASLRAGAPVSPSSTKPYGCGVKYAE